MSKESPLGSSFEYPVRLSPGKKDDFPESLSAERSLDGGDGKGGSLVRNIPIFPFADDLRIIYKGKLLDPITHG